MKMITKRYEKQGYKWRLVSTSEEEYTQENWEANIIGAIPFNIAIGGQETLTVWRTKLRSVSPDEQVKVVRQLVAK